MVGITHIKYLEYIFRNVTGVEGMDDSNDEAFEFPYNKLAKRVRVLEEQSATREKLNKAYDHNAKLVAQYMDVFQSMERELQLLHIRIDDLEKDVGNK